MKSIDVAELGHAFITVSIPVVPWFLKVEFLQQLLELGWRTAHPNDDQAWITTLAPFNLRAVEYDDDSKYKRTTTNKTSTGLTFVHVYERNESMETVLANIKSEVSYLFKLLQKRNRSSCGELFVDYMVKKQADPLFRWFMKQNNNDHEKISVSINEELHVYGSRSIEFMYEEHYDKCFVNYDIKGFLSTYAGVNSWADASNNMKSAVYKNYPGRKTLPNWEAIVKETY